MNGDEISISIMYFYDRNEVTFSCTRAGLRV